MDYECKKELIELYSLSRRTDRIFTKFVNDIKDKKVKNDGTNELLNIIDKYVFGDDSQQFHTTVKKGEIFYRARIIDIESLEDNNDIFVNVCANTITSGYGESDSRECPLGISKPGRNNIEGSTYIYLANEPGTACVEVKPIVTDVISLARFKIMRDLKVIDFSGKKDFDYEKSKNEKLMLDELFTKIMRQYYLPVSNSEEYIATQFLTDYIRKKGVDGIAYGSYYDKNGINYTIFNCDRQIVKYIDSKIVYTQSEEKIFTDFDNKQNMKVSSKGKKEYDERNAKVIAAMLSVHKSPNIIDLEEL